MWASDAEVISLMRSMYPMLTITVASDDYLLAWMDWARALVSVHVAGRRYGLAVALLLAHQVYSDDPDGSLGGAGAGAAGPIASMSSSRRAVSYALTSGGNSTSNEDAMFASTSPGRRWLQLRATFDAVIGPWYME